MLSLLWITLALLLVLLNAFFVAAEFGMVRLRQTRVEAIEEIYGLRGKILARVHQHLDAYLSACQLGITLASLGLGWIGEPALSALLRPFFEFIGVSAPAMIEFLAFFVGFSILSFLHIVVGELMPKSLAIRQSEKVSVWTALPLYGFYWLMFPAIWMLNACSNFLLKIFKLNEVHSGENFYSTDEIKLILNTSHLHGELKKAEKEILEHTLDFADLLVTDVMRPIDEMIALDLQQPVDELLNTIMRTRYSRYPIIEDNEIIGVAHIKDLFSALYEHKQIHSIKEVMRPILKISAQLPALGLLRKFRDGSPHFAIIYYGSGAPVGFVTLDNLLHILVGRIKDEFHKTHDDWEVLPDGGFLMKGNCPIYSVERAINLDGDIEVEGDITTLYGLIINKLGALPKVNERIEFTEFTAIITKMQGPKVVEVKIYPKTK